MDKIKVLAIDDSSVVRMFVSRVLQSDPDIELVGTAPNGRIGLEKIERYNPDVIILDIEMPELDGFGVLETLRAKKISVRTIMFSTLTSRGASLTLKALTLGASDYVCKPEASTQIKQVAEELLPKIKQFFRGRNGIGSTAETVTAKRSSTPSAPLESPTISAKREPVERKAFSRPELVVIGISTGGPVALTEVVPKFSRTLSIPVVIVQHMPPVFTKHFATTLNNQSQIDVVEGEEGQALQPGFVYIAPGGYHTTVVRMGREMRIRLNQDAPENYCRPAADVLFRSVARSCADKVLCVVMTGMGKDGFKGAQLLKSNGCRVFAQDEESSVVWGMPSFIVKGGLADEVLPLSRIAERIETVCK